MSRGIKGFFFLIFFSTPSLCDLPFATREGRFEGASYVYSDGMMKRGVYLTNKYIIPTTE